MKITVKYCGYCRKDGSYNMITFDTETKTFTNSNYPDNRWDKPYGTWTFVEAKMNKDVNNLRERLIADGYQEEE